MVQMFNCYSCIPIPSSTSKHYSLCLNCFILNDLCIWPSPISSRRLPLLLQLKILILFILSLKHYIVADVLWMNAWAQTHFTHESQKLPSNMRCLWPVNLAFNKVWCNGLFSTSSSAILTIMLKLFMVLLSECF